MTLGERVFLDEMGRPIKPENDGALIILYDGKEDLLRVAFYAEAGRLETMLAACIADHINTLNGASDEDTTAEALRNIFEGAKERLRRKSDGNN